MLAIIGLGVYIARQITLPLDELVNTAQSVTAGDLRRRSRVRSKNEIGELSRSFNTMTESLLHLYNRVQAERGQLAAIVESIGDGIVVCNRSGHIQMANRAMRRWLGLNDEDALPLKFADLPLLPLPEGERAFSPDHVSNLQVIGERIVRVSDAPIMAKGQYLGDVYVLQDMTDEVNIDRAKTSFIGTISHELRTPITTLLGTTDLMGRGMFGRMEDRQTSEVKIMHNKLAHMTRLINNVIVIADIDSGSLPFDLEATWKMQKDIKEKGLSLTIDISEDLPTVLADYDHAQTIIRQIVDNARRYTAEGGITIRAERENDFVRIDVIDTGSGIEPDMREQVFERFVRGMGKGQGVDSQERGLGLGLAIVKQLVNRHGGHVWVTNAAGQGSVFSFTLRHTDVMGTPEKQDEAFGTAA
jgi:signal transduction histidine kinase